MTRIPTFEDLLLEVHQGLGIQLDAKKKQRFADQEMRFQGHVDTVSELLQAILDALGMDKLDEWASADARGNFVEWASFHKAVELRVWTGNASQQQVLWHLLVYAYVPGLARRIAFWRRAAEQQGKPWDTAMPGGRFWFLPHWDKEADRVTLPLAHVLDGMRGGESLENAYGDKLRTIQGWRAGKHLPRPSEIGEFGAKGIDDTWHRRLKIARLVQYGYVTTLKFLCPDTEPTCTDPSRNKLLQLVELFKSIFDWTVEAAKRGGSFNEQDRRFEADLMPVDKDDILLSILPSRFGTAYNDLARMLTRRFMRMPSDQALDDIVPWDEASAESIIGRRLWLIEQEHEEDRRIAQLTERVRLASPWRALQAEGSYWVVSQLAGNEVLPDNIRKMATQRMRELATSSGQRVWAILIELGMLLNCDPPQRHKDAQKNVQSLLSEAEASAGYAEWKAPLLFLRAKHRLFQNDFGGAMVDFQVALEACRERAFGVLRGQIAKDGWAVNIAMSGFIPENQEWYYRNMMNYMEFPNGSPSIETAAVGCEEFFWQKLYSPYRGVELVEGPAVIQYKKLFKETLTLIDLADWDGLRVWLKRNGATFRKNLKDARRNSVLLAWLKMRWLLKPNMRDSLLEAIRVLLEAWPEQVRIADFKNQTPLMLVADDGDVDLTCLLAPHSDADSQDYLGRTALHAAVSGGSSECIGIVMDRGPMVSDKVTKDEGNTALHTAVRFGVPEHVRMIAEEFPDLLSKANLKGQVPLGTAEEIFENYDEWREYMVCKHGRHVGPQSNFEEIVKYLRPACLGECPLDRRRGLVP